ncbi:cobyric acid synthase [Thalassotalea euphylliae]|uniref:Cobyric acid synthase n=1 Tax=Thalassotalea euphylliae TaxID=1655234 RepID=A0A3E0TN70_9GAMM|nr:cobyric acid synthase [Thalassotalea euphylliae]REL25465.1 cobyric acid synthase [Thalassotalea euphylliae]
MQTIMVQGTTSDAGKSTLLAGLCRALANRALSIAPFKPQNMALNSAVAAIGDSGDVGEIGRAQALQAIAAKVPAQVDFNPILLKPNSDTGAQVIVHGRAINNMEAAAYQDYKKVAMDAVLTSYQRLSHHYHYLLVEGAGSPAEINLRAGDIANMGFAEAVDCPVIIIADIDKGGVFAHLVGTLALLSPSEQARVKGFVINRFRGDIGLLQSGLDWLEQETGKPVLGVLPYLHDLALDAEDALALANVKAPQTTQINIVVLLVPHISNHTDFDSLRLNPGVNLEYVRVGQVIPSCDLIILPGSKNVIGDYQFIESQGWSEQIKQHLRYGGKVLGICGGLQMLGNKICDPCGIESSVAEQKTLGIADFETELSEEKALVKVTAELLLESQPALKDKAFESSDDPILIQGYEIHCGISQGKALHRPLAKYRNVQGQEVSDGFVTDDGQVIGTYLHGLFDKAAPTQAILHWVKPQLAVPALDLDLHREQELERLAAVCEQHLDIDRLLDITQEFYRHGNK